MARSYPRYDPTGVPRARALRRAAPVPERLLWSRLRRRQLGVRVLRQHPVGPFVVDFACPERRLVIEVDGRSHDGRAAADAAREAVLRRAGYRVLRLPNDDVLRDLDGVVARVAAALTDPPP